MSFLRSLVVSKRLSYVIQYINSKTFGFHAKYAIFTHVSVFSSLVLWVLNLPPLREIYRFPVTTIVVCIKDVGECRIISQHLFLLTIWNQWTVMFLRWRFTGPHYKNLSFYAISNRIYPLSEWKQTRRRFFITWTSPPFRAHD